MSDMPEFKTTKCEFREGENRDGAYSCTNAADYRVQIGYYAGSWRLCRDHILPIIKVGVDKKMDVHVDPLPGRSTYPNTRGVGHGADQAGRQSEG